MAKVYGYVRISRKEQNPERQVRNIKAEYPSACIISEAFTGTKTQGRKKFEALIKKVQPGDVIIFDSVSRMSRNADEGIALYMSLFDRGVKLVFLKEQYVSTDIFASRIQQSDISTGKAYLDEGLKVILMGLAREQIRIAFDQAEKEVEDLHQRTREGIETARLAGKQIGQIAGKKLNVKKAAPAKAVILKRSKYFGGDLSDTEVMKLAGISRNTFKKYRAELAAEAGEQ